MTLYQLPTKWLDRIASSYRIPIQWQETCGNRMDSIWTQLWKTPMERQPSSTNRVSEIRRISYRTIKKLERGHEVNGSGSKEYEEAIWQEMKESSRIEGWRQCVAREQKYPCEQTLKEVGPKKI